MVEKDVHIRKFQGQCARDAEEKKTVQRHRAADIQQQHQARAHAAGRQKMQFGKCPARPGAMAQRAPKVQPAEAFEPVLLTA